MERMDKDQPHSEEMDHPQSEARVSVTSSTSATKRIWDEIETSTEIKKTKPNESFMAEENEINADTKVSRKDEAEEIETKANVETKFVETLNTEETIDDTAKNPPEITFSNVEIKEHMSEFDTQTESDAQSTSVATYSTTEKSTTKKSPFTKTRDDPKNQNTRSDGSPIHENDEYIHVYEKFTNFDDLVEDFPMNMGTFGILYCKHIGIADNLKLTEPVTNVVFVDSQKRKSVFTIFGANAENWGHLKIGEVVFLENFKWRKDYRNQGRFYGVSTEFCGILTEESTFEISVKLSAMFAQFRDHQIDHISFLTDIQDQCDRMVLILEQKKPKEAGKSEKGPYTRRRCLFSTADGIMIPITGFEKNCEKFDALDEHKVYIIEDLKKREGAEIRQLEFTVTTKTAFRLATMQPNVIQAIKISLAELMTGNFNQNTVYETDGFVRQSSVTVKGKEFSQTVIFQKHENNYIAVLIRFTDVIELKKGEKVSFMFHIENFCNKLLLKVVPGSFTSLKDHISAEEIGATKFTII